MKSKILGLLAVGLLAGPMAAQAIPVTWTLQNVVFQDGRSASGSFSFDADTTTFSGIDITVNDGGNLIAMSVFRYGDPQALNLFGPTGATIGETFLQLGFNPVLSNAGGTASLLGGGATTGIGNCASIDQPLNCPLTNVSLVLAGASVTSVPEPGTLALLGLGLAGLGLSRRRKAN